MNSKKKKASRQQEFVLPAPGLSIILHPPLFPFPFRNHSGHRTLLSTSLSLVERKMAASSHSSSIQVQVQVQGSSEAAAYGVWLNEVVHNFSPSFFSRSLWDDVLRIIGGSIFLGGGGVPSLFRSSIKSSQKKSQSSKSSMALARRASF